MLPEGFFDFVAVTIKNWDWDVLREEDAEVWDALLYPVFLSRTVRTRESEIDLEDMEAEEE
ncbi:MAG: hypothetical protein QMD23_02615 [Candidatus Bathyarchaeia archaeon]|nr:hypothetical protein [Candidatus Bathyarchaeia archaeon]